MSRIINGREYFCGEEIERSFTRWRDARIEELEAEVERLREALKSTAAFLHHCWCNVQMSDYSFQKLNEQMEIVHAAIDVERGAREI